MPKHVLGAVFALILAASAVLAPSSADAFCGFYVSGADGKLFNNATQVVMMREGTRTVLSMQNNYEGPPSDFAMVIPVPVVLKEENVKTLSNEIFDKIDKMAAPRLVEYWEIDPCAQMPEYEIRAFGAPGGPVDEMAADDDEGGSVKIEAQFEVGEYQIVILSATDSGALDKWLRGNKYNIPEGAEPVLRPYVEKGTKFFVAKVNARKVRFEGNKAVLSPLRFHYDTEEFSLPIRLGMLNAKGHQDLIVHVLAKGQRYEVANYKNVTIPTNIGVGQDAKARFGEFYASLFDRTLEKNKGAVITEYSWDASTCDPCPGPNLDQNDFMTLGADVVPSKQAWGYVLTRLHARYTKDNLGEDLVFKAAPPIVGGREWYKKDKELEKGSTASGVNNFQGRYIIRNPWKGEIKCDDPVRGRWGGPSGQIGSRPAPPRAAQKLAEVPRGKLELASIVREDVPEIGLKTAGGGGGSGDEDDKPAEGPKEGGDKGEEKKAPPAEPKDEGCASLGTPNASPWLLLGFLGLCLAARRRR